MTVAWEGATRRTTRVGVTGGIGSGKSAVCKLFSELGIPVYDSDARARKLMNGLSTCSNMPVAGKGETVEGGAGGEIKRAIVALLGAEAYRDGVLDNSFVAGKVFADKMLLASLNAIVHPAVALDFEAWTLSFADRPYIVLESAILFESGFDRLVDRVIAVSAPEAVRLERVLARSGKGVSRQEVMRRMANQLTDADREARADFLIYNSGSLAELADRVKELDKQLKR